MPMSSFDEALWRFRRRLPKAALIYVAGCSGEPLALASFLERHPEWADGVTFLGIWIPGVNQVDWTLFHDSARSESIFVTPATQAAFGRNAFSFRPLSYTQSVGWLNATPLDGAIVMTAGDDGDDALSLGVSADFSGLPLARSDVPALAIANVAMPNPHNTVRIPRTRFVEIIAADTPLLQIAPSHLTPAFTQLGHHVASLIDDGDTLQFGLGTVQQAVLEALSDHQHLRIHSGMVSDPVLGLLDRGALDESPGAITTGVAIGTDQLYQRLAEDRSTQFRPVEHTHTIATLSAIPRFKAINSCLSVDLFGQVNGEFIGTRQGSGTGGLVDVLRGAQLSPGGSGILALSSTARKGTLSRIVPRLDPNAVAVARQDVDIVVTEHGIARLAGLSIDQRAEALISVADPAFRDKLSNDWDRMRKDMA